MRPTTVLLAPWTAATHIAGAWTRHACASCAHAWAQTRAARTTAAHEHQLNLALTARLDAAQREIAHLEADLREALAPRPREDVSV